MTPAQAKKPEGAVELTPAEFQSQVDAYTDELCSHSTLHAKSDGTKIELEGTSYPIKDFGAALAQRYKKAPYNCVDIVGPGQEAQLVSSYVKALAGTDVTSIGWRVEGPEAGHDAARP